MTSVVCKRFLHAIMKTPNDVPTWLTYTITVNILFKASIFPVIVKKNNQSPVSDADQEISTLGSMDNVGNSVNGFKLVI